MAQTVHFVIDGEPQVGTLEGHDDHFITVVTADGTSYEIDDQWLENPAPESA